MSEVLMMPGIVFFVKAKCDLDVFPPTHGALELNITRANYQAKIWLQAIRGVFKNTQTDAAIPSVFD